MFYGAGNEVLEKNKRNKKTIGLVREKNTKCEENQLGKMVIKNDEDLQWLQMPDKFWTLRLNF